MSLRDKQNGQRRGDVEVRNYLRDAAGSRSLVFDLSITHDRIGSSCHVQQKGSLSHTRDLDAPLCIAAHRKLTRYRQQYADNQNISFLPAIMTTSSRIHGEFLRLLFLHAHRETTAHFHATGLSSQQNRSDKHTLPGWAPDPRWTGGWACTSHLEFWVRFSNENTSPHTRIKRHHHHHHQQLCNRYCSNKHTHILKHTSTPL